MTSTLYLPFKNLSGAAMSDSDWEPVGDRTDRRSPHSRIFAASSLVAPHPGTCRAKF